MQTMRLNKRNRSMPLLLFIAISMVFSCGKFKAPSFEHANVVQYGNKRTSIISLIGNPATYHKQVVQVEGFLNLEFEASAIYLHKIDRDLGIDKNGIWIKVSRADLEKLLYLHQKYVILEGTFDMDNQGHLSSYSGALTNLRMIKALPIANGSAE